jgi:hypothetical protein
MMPPIRGSFDVYLSAPADDGSQELRFVSVSTGATVTQVTLRTDDKYAVRAGQYVYFYAEGSRQPQRVNTAGSIETLTFAAPDPGALLYEFLPSATGYYLAWLNVASDGASFTISTSYVDGSDMRTIYTGPLEGNVLPHLVRITNDGTRIFFDKHPWADEPATMFGSIYDLYMVDARTGTESHLPGEPGCGEGLFCDGHVSPDGSYLVRTLAQGRAAEPVIITNLTTSSVVQRFTMQPIPEGAAAAIGYPLFTPSGNLVYIQAIGPREYAEYLLVQGNLVTGEQQLVLNLGTDRYRPVGWADAANLLLTREPGVYDTWQVNVETGAFRQIAGLLFLGHIEEPPLTPY